MNTRVNPYDSLYNNLKNRFTVIHNGQECTVGDFMRMKSGAHCASNLPLNEKNSEDGSIAAVINYVSDKLTIKNAPMKDKTMKRFPIRTSLSATISAVAACALIMFTGIITSGGLNDNFLSSENKPYIETVDDLAKEDQNTDSINPTAEK